MATKSDGVRDWLTTCRAGQCRIFVAAVAACLSLALTACQDPELDFNLSDLKMELFEPKRPPRECMMTATSESDADTRREALVRVARSPEYAEPWAVDGYVTIALLETDSQTRCVAIRSLERIADDRAMETLLRVMSADGATSQPVRPTSDVCRADAALSVSRMLETGKVTDERRAAAGPILRKLLTGDSNAGVRRAAARGLGFIRDPENVSTLIAGLRDTEFSVVYECEDSLVRLTGVTQRTNAADWETWLEQNRDSLFAGAGNVPESRRSPYDGPFGKTMHDMKTTWDWLFPADAEE